MINVRKVIIALACGLLLTGSYAAHAIQIGNDAINRGTSDGFSNFVIVLPTKTFPSNGFIGSWNVLTALTGDLALLILSGSEASPTVEGVFQETIATTNTALNFAITPDFSASAGEYLGIWMGNAKVEYDTVGVDIEDIRFSSNGIFPSAPSVGSTIMSISPTTLQRAYSINSIFNENPTGAAPEPTTILLLGLGIAGLGFARRRLH